MTDPSHTVSPPYYGAVSAPLLPPAGSAPPPEGAYPPAYPQPGQQAPQAPYTAEPPPKYEVPKEGPYAPQQPAGYHQPTTTVYTQPVATTLLITPNFGPHSCLLTCPHCHQQISTSISYKSGALAWLSAGIICVFGCWLGCCLIPFCISDLQDVDHTCPNCNRLVGTYHRL